MPKPVKIWFITWPDGKMFEKTQTSADERQAWAKAMHSWLPVDCQKCRHQPCDGSC